jgi:Lon protease-like protein
MMQDCLRQRIPVAVCHVKRVIEEAKTQRRTLESNQSTYEPVPVLSYGPVTLKETMGDGRMLVEVTMQRRGRILGLLQEVPYYIAEVEELADEDAPPSAQQSILRAELTARFVHIWNLAQPNGAAPPFDLDAVPFSSLSFHILSFMAIDPVFAQTLLEVRDPVRRATIVCEILRAAEANVS